MSIRLPPLPTVRDLLRLYRVRALKQLSQNFLMQESAVEKIAKAAPALQHTRVLEVGPGPGPITRSIIRRNPDTLILVEKDIRFKPFLDMLTEAIGNKIKVKIIYGDILKTDLETPFNDVHVPETLQEWQDTIPPIRLIGNLPFSVSTILTIRWLEMIHEKRGAWKYGRTPMTLTFQKEVAERMAAGPKSNQRCRLSLMCQNWCTVHHKFNISGKAFIPKPDVDVGVVSLIPKPVPLIPMPFKTIEKFFRTMFHMRQKHSYKCAELLFPEEVRKEIVLRMYEAAEISPRIRPFQITNQDYAKLCIAYGETIKNYPQYADFNFRACKKTMEVLEEEMKHEEPKEEDTVEAKEAAVL